MGAADGIGAARAGAGIRMDGASVDGSGGPSDGECGCSDGAGGTVAVVEQSRAALGGRVRDPSPHDLFGGPPCWWGRHVVWERSSQQSAVSN